MKLITDPDGWYTSCYECDGDHDKLIVLGDDDVPDAIKFPICKSCIIKAAEKFGLYVTGTHPFNPEVEMPTIDNVTQIDETAYILSIEANRARLKESMRQIEAGEAKERELKK